MIKFPNYPTWTSQNQKKKIGHPPIGGERTRN
jgi:hypothetical protein